MIPGSKTTLFSNISWSGATYMAGILTSSCNGYIGTCIFTSLVRNLTCSSSIAGRVTLIFTHGYFRPIEGDLAYCGFLDRRPFLVYLEFESICMHLLKKESCLLIYVSFQWFDE